MSIRKIPTKSGGVLIIGEGSADRVDPIEFFRKHTIETKVALLKQKAKMKDPFMPTHAHEPLFVEEGEKLWEKRLQQMEDAPLAENFLQLLESKRKNEQEKLLKGMEITAMGLGGLFIKAGRDHGYSYSSYRVEKVPSDINEAQLPRVFHITKKGDLERYGQSPMTDKQLRGFFNQKNALIARVLDRGGEWHCFFQMERALRGAEGWKGGQPHIHYISDKWGISRKQLDEMIKSGSMSSSIHIALVDYGTQPSNTK